MAKRRLLEGLTEEQIAKVRACNSGAELIELARIEGVQLSSEQLAAITGGGCSDSDDYDKKKETDDNGHRRIES